MDTPVGGGGRTFQPGTKEGHEGTLRQLQSKICKDSTRHCSIKWMDLPVDPGTSKMGQSAGLNHVYRLCSITKNLQKLILEPIFISFMFRQRTSSILSKERERRERTYYRRTRAFPWSSPSTPQSEVGFLPRVQRAICLQGPRVGALGKALHFLGPCGHSSDVLGVGG